MSEDQHTKQDPREQYPQPQYPELSGRELAECAVCAMPRLRCSLRRGRRDLHLEGFGDGLVNRHRPAFVPGLQIHRLAEGPPGPRQSFGERRLEQRDERRVV